MLTDRARVATAGIVAPVVDVLARAGITPNALTVVGCAMHLGVAWLLATGHQVGAGVALAVCAAFDALDGSLARRTGRTTAFGAFLDSTLDRVSEIIVFVGALLFGLRSADPTTAVLACVALAGSLMVSYSRARSEALGCGTKAGLFGRLERMLVLVLALVASRLTLALWVLAIGTWITTAQRVLDVARRCARRDG